MAALVEIQPVTPTQSGVDVPVYDDTANTAAIVLTASTDIKIPNDGHVYIRVRRTGTTASTLTVTTTATAAGLAVNDRSITLSVTSGDLFEYGPFEPDLYNDENGEMTISFSDASDIDLSVIRSY